MSKKILTLDNVPVINKKIGKIDTIEKLKASTIYSIGDVVEVLGFHAKGDGSHHKRVAKAEDDGSGELGQGGIWWCIVHSGEVNVSWFGAKGDGVTDDTLAIQRAIVFCRKVLFEVRKTYAITSLISLDENLYWRGYELNGNNSTLKKINKTGFQLHLYSQKVILKDIVLDGDSEEYWDIVNSAEKKVFQYLGLVCEYPTLENVRFLNMWGYTTSFTNYRTAVIKSCSANNIGGKWKENDGDDSFGDCFYFQDPYKSELKPMISVEDCDITMRSFEGGITTKRNSRGGIVFESDLEHIEVNINLKNNIIRNANRGLHVENIKETQKILINDIGSKYINCDMFLQGLKQDGIFLSSDSCYYENVEGFQNFGGFNAFSLCNANVKNSILTSNKKGINLQRASLVFEDCSFFLNSEIQDSFCNYDCEITYTRCRFVSNFGWLVSRNIANKSEFLGCNFNVNGIVGGIVDSVLNTNRFVVIKNSKFSGGYPDQFVYSNSKTTKTSGLTFKLSTYLENYNITLIAQNTSTNRFESLLSIKKGEFAKNTNIKDKANIVISNDGMTLTVSEIDAQIQYQNLILYLSV